MASELVHSATSDKLAEPDWMANIHLCESVARDPRQAKDVIKAIKKRLGSKNPTVQLYAVTLLEMLMNNIGENVHRQVIDTDLLSLLVKTVKKKSDLPVREKIFLLLDATQTSVGGASGKFPQYYAAYCDLVNAGVQFPSSANVSVNVTTVKAETKSTQDVDIAHPKPADDKNIPAPAPQSVPDSSIIQKASTTLQVLKEVLEAVDSQNPEEARNEFTLDLVEQCSFQKQRVMHLIVTSCDEKVVSEAITLNDQLEGILRRHDALISGRVSFTAGASSLVEPRRRFANDEEEEEEEQLLRRTRKGKARMQPEVEEAIGQGNGLMKSLTIAESLVQQPHSRTHSYSDPLHDTRTSPPVAGVLIPPPPAKHVERERFFQEKRVDPSNGAGHTLHSRNASSSGSVNSFID